MPLPEHPTPHDTTFKLVFRRTPNALALMQAVLPADVLEAIEPESLVPDETSVIDKDLRSRFTDVLFHARLKDGSPAVVYFLLEHQHDVDPWMPHRLLGYLVRIWEDWRRKNPTANKLPVVIPLVLHQGPKPWTAARSMDDLYDSAPDLLAGAGALLPRLDLALLDLGERTPVGASELRGPVLMKLTLALLRAMADPKPDVFAVLKARGHLLRELYLQAGGPRDAEELIEYVLLVMQEIDVAALGRAVAEAAGHGAGEVVMTAAEKLRNEGRVKSLLQQLEELFAPLSDDTKARVEGASTEDLDAWSRAVLRAKRLEDVFNPRPKPSSRRTSRRGKGNSKKKR